MAPPPDADNRDDKDDPATGGDAPARPWDDTPPKPPAPLSPRDDDGGDDGAAADDATVEGGARRGASRNAIVAVLAILVLVGAGLATWPQWKEFVPRNLFDPAPDGADVTTIADGGGIAAPSSGDGEPAGDTKPAAGAGAEDSVTAVAPPGQAAPGGDDALAARLDSLEARIARLEGRAGQPDPGGDGASRARTRENSGALTAMAERVATLETALTTTRDEVRAGRSDSLVLAVGHLREAVSRGDAFAAELAALKGVAGGNRAVAGAMAPLAARASGGVATLATLKARFDSTAAAVARAALAPETGGWADRTVARLATVVTIRRTGADVKGDTPTAILARAEATLRDGKLDEAATILGGLVGGPAAAAKAWLDDARARVAVDRAMGALTRVAIARLAAAEAKPAGAPPGGEPRQRPGGEPRQQQDN